MLSPTQTYTVDPNYKLVSVPWDTTNVYWSDASYLICKIDKTILEKVVKGK